ncbi:MAG: hypothetical protein ACRERU_22680 [Methylococcales bacterium]
MKLEKVTYYLQRQDDRGALFGITNRGNWREVNLFSSKAGAIRGNHYNQSTIEFVFLLRGSARVTTYHQTKPAQRTTTVLKAGEGHEIPPNVVHLTEYLEDSETLALRDRPFHSEDVRNV